MSGRIAETEVCDDQACAISHLLVRGDHISFVSVEQAKAVGKHPLDDRAMPSDIKLPKDYVLVHDTSGTLFNRCELYVVKWYGGARSVSGVRKKNIRIARDYFGKSTPIKTGFVEIPNGSWKRLAKVQFVRYRRQGYLSDNYEHEYNPPVFLYSTKSGPLAWRLSLPNGCIVDARGFVRP